MTQKLKITQMLLFGTRRLNVELQMQQQKCRNEMLLLNTQTNKLKHSLKLAVTSPKALVAFCVAGFSIGYFSRAPMPHLNKTVNFILRQAALPIMLKVSEKLFSQPDPVEDNSQLSENNIH